MTDNSGCAFPSGETLPTSSFSPSHGKPLYLGLTKREYFAGLAMQGIVASSEGASAFDGGTIKSAIEFLGLPDSTKYEPNKHYPMCIAKASRLCADALLAELAKESEGDDE